MTSSARLNSIQETFVEQFESAPTLIVRAPGRVNLIGEHTDYNEGFVFPAAIDREMLVAAGDNSTDIVNAYSLDYKKIDTFDVNSFGRSNDNPWADYLRGVIDVLQKRSLPVRGFNAVLSGNVPQGAGLSSSAAYEVAIAVLCRELNHFDADGKEISLIAQQAENRFIGVQCGIMDQFISALGKEDSALLIDCRSLEFRPVPLNLSANDYAIVITNSGVSRELADSAYNKRRSECGEGVRLISELLGKSGVSSLRDVELSDFEKCTNRLPDMIMRRCRHVVSENKRVLDAVDALERGDLETFGTLMNASHASLRDDYEVSSCELDTLVELSQNHPGVLGARMTGAGFGGCTVAIVKNDAVETFEREVVSKYEKATGKKAQIYVCSATAGASRLSTARV